MSSPSVATGGVRRLALPLGVVLGALLCGELLAALSASVWQNRMFPWTATRGFGIAAYVDLAFATAVGLWLRHPWQRRLPGPTPGTLLRLHATMIAAAAMITAAHIGAVLADGFAHVGFVGALLPGRSGYRPLGMACGTVGLYLAVLVGATAWLSGLLVGRFWLPIHRLAYGAFFLIWVHGVLTGSDVPALRVLYVASGLLVVLLAVSRRLVTDPLHPAVVR
ncbi:MAG TPA: hypothetical protein VLR26_08250 [Frankiaceae bacterium]|nr:hypothetical protein [Frankiaceae bacterium]